LVTDAIVWGALLALASLEWRLQSTPEYIQSDLGPMALLLGAPIVVVAFAWWELRSWGRAYVRWTLRGPGAGVSDLELLRSVRRRDLPGLWRHFGQVAARHDVATDGKVRIGSLPLGFAALVVGSSAAVARLVVAPSQGSFTLWAVAAGAWGAIMWFVAAAPLREPAEAFVRAAHGSPDVVPSRGKRASDNQRPL